ncbi:ribosomal protein S18-alanine N-acetyltransferase [Gammaproteobacteria bacterium]|nr:ribosomal protein S18-alanine N-acetyltransferase [SAR86 cluster bacterium]MDB3975924.1 ribosomal protein S18-alanine N-acetyltransferase [Gammaproteobacteria bacterium]MDC0569945.1 ribosomal protein S18-alanine N-acetyltransferase [Gammaproteobacteria bacterium]
MDYSYLDQSHLASILEIENESNPFPWTEGNFKDCLDKGYYSLALEDKNKFIGFAIMAISTDESHLLNIGINKNERGMGYGEKLLKKMIIAAEVMGSRKIILEVRLSNKTAYQLYKKLGFEEIGIRKKYYRLPEGREDAYVLSKSLKQDLISKFFFAND